MHFLDNLDGKNRISFKDGILAVQKLKCNFVYNLWSWNRIYLGDQATDAVDFMEWLASLGGLVRIFVVCLAFCVFGDALYTACVLCGFLLIYSVFIYQKKKESPSYHQIGK